MPRIEKVYMWKDKPRLPSAYQEVEYIKSTAPSSETYNYQYIDTGILTNGADNTEIESDVRFYANTTYDSAMGKKGRIRFFFGVLGSSSATTSYRGCFWGGGNDKYGYTSMSNDFKKHNFRISTSASILYIDGTAYNVNTQTSSSSTYSGNISIFGAQYSFGGTTYYEGNANAEVYSFKIRRDGILIRDFVPCYRKSDNKTGMYDLVQRIFYPSSGSGGDLAKGPDVNSFEQKIYPTYSWKPSVNTLIYYPLTSNLTDYMGKGNTGVAHGNVTFNAADGDTSGCYVSGQNSIYVTGLSMGINGKTNGTLNVRCRFISCDQYGNICGYPSNYAYTQPFIISGNTSSNAQSFLTAKNVQLTGNYTNRGTVSGDVKALNSGWHNFGFSIINGKVRGYIDGRPVQCASGVYVYDLGGTLGNGTSEMQLGRGGLYTSGRRATGYIRDYIVESIGWSEEDFLNYYNRSKHKVGL